MSIQTIPYLKSRFTCGKKPTQKDYVDLIDTLSQIDSTQATHGPVVATGLYATIFVSGSALKMPLYK